jgi:Family of unknown function (DUF5996)
MQSEKTKAAWPSLPLKDWADTQATVHRWTQIVGKTRLEFAPMQNHWWQVVLYVTSRGLTTSPIPYRDGRTFEVGFDFIDHQLSAETSDGERRTMGLEPRTVADFYAEYRQMLHDIGISVKIFPVPMELPDTLRFDQDQVHASYDRDAANRAWQVLVHVDRVLKEFRARFLGKVSPSNFWWGAFDLACTRFSGRPAPVHPGGVPNCPDYVMREGYSHECISAGWWPGNVGGPIDQPAFYAYSYPEPAGYDISRVGPSAAYYDTQLREWILPYERVRASDNPDDAVLEFLQTTYDRAADLAKWDRARLGRPDGWTPPPSAAEAREKSGSP